MVVPPALVKYGKHSIPFCSANDAFIHFEKLEILCAIVLSQFLFVSCFGNSKFATIVFL